MSNTRNEAALAGKLLVSGELVLDSPCLIGAGGTTQEGGVDIEILRDKDGVPYLPGTSLAGVLRAFVAADTSAASEAESLLFGTLDAVGAAKSGLMSMVSIDDVRLSNADVTTRDGVTIDDDTGTAVKHHKFDYEAVSERAHGIFSMEITLRDFHEQHAVQEALTRLREKLLHGFSVGARTTKGFGHVHVEHLTVDRYDFHEKEDVRAYLQRAAGLSAGTPKQHKEYQSDVRPLAARGDFFIEADFSLRGALLVRDYDKGEREAHETDENSVAAVMKQDAFGNYLLPGTSLRGALRHRVVHIMDALGKDRALVEALMGPSPETMKREPTLARRSKFFVEEARISPQKVRAVKQSRNRIDRFTGGTIDTALFSTEPIWQNDADEATLTLRFGVHLAAGEKDAQDACEKHRWMAGVTLLLLKDLWLGRIALGGEKGIGRGTLRGRSARIFFGEDEFAFSEEKPLAADAAAKLTGYVEEFLLQEEGGVA